MLPPDTIALPQFAGEAFGDGSHPTTRLCAGALDLLCRLHRPRSVLDVGTGTGVLARIARARGASFVVGTDIDPSALAAARENIALDRLPGEILISGEMPDFWGPRFDLVVANILEGPLRELAPALSRALVPGGILLLSGFTRLQIPALQTAYSRLNFISESALEEWALLTLQFMPLHSTSGLP
ncbi:MAG: 50S ribosomal protein L11 methyltransferase [Bdellovibrionota bacterium]